MTIGERIKKMRLEKGMSQSDLARKAGYNDKTAISKFEHAGDDISMKQIKRVAEALDTSPSYLMGWTSFVDKDGVEITYCDPDTSVGLSLASLLVDSPAPAASPAPSRYTLINKRLDLLNDEGLSKVMDYTNDLVETGKYAVNAAKKEA